jgi:hypothetical protein
MKWLRKSKEPSNAIPDDPATEKQKQSIAHNLETGWEGLSAAGHEPGSGAKKASR